MNRIYTLFLVLITMNSCQKILRQDTAVLSKHTQIIIDYFLDETEGWYDDENMLEICGCISEDSNYYYLNIFAVDSSFDKPFGKCKGNLRYRGYDISLFGDSWNDYMWSSDTTYNIFDTNSYIQDDYWCYDPIMWSICICVHDTTINRQKSEFAYRSTLPITYMDSIEKIISVHY